MLDALATKGAVVFGAFLSVELLDVGHGLEQELITAAAAAAAAAFIWRRVLRPGLGRVFREVIDTHPQFDPGNPHSMPNRLDRLERGAAEAAIDRQRKADELAKTVHEQ